MKFNYIIICLLVLCNTNYAQTSVFTQSVNISPINNSNGLVGSMTVKYAFNNCSGDAFMGYGYSNIQIQYLLFDGERINPSELGISNFSDYVIIAKSEVDIYRISGGSKVLVKSKYLNNMDKKNSFGCYSIGVNIGSEEKDHLNLLRATFSNATVSYDAGLESKAKSFLKEKEDAKKFKELILQVEETNDSEEKISLLKEAKSYTNNDKEIDQRIEKIKNEIRLTDNKNSFNTIPSNSEIKNEADQNLSIGNQVVKQPHEYSKNEWENLSKTDQELSIELLNNENLKLIQDYQLQNEKLKKVIETETDANMAVINGDLRKAANIYTEAGDYQSALGVEMANALIQSGIFESDPKKEAARQKKLEARWKRNLIRKNVLNVEPEFNVVNDVGLYVKRNDKGWYGYVDENQNWIIEPIYLRTYPFINGLGRAYTKTGKEINLDKNGELR